jgi:hypothetical protein
VEGILSSQQASVHDEAGGSSKIFSSQQASEQEATLAVEGPLLDPERDFAVDPHALVLGVQQESADTQELTEARGLDGFLFKEDRRGGTQQDSWPRASSAEQMQPIASSAN